MKDEPAEAGPKPIPSVARDASYLARSAVGQRTNPLPREGLAARSGDYVCRSNSLNERR